MKRVVITGMGAITPIGNSVDEFWKGIEESKCGIDEITQIDTTNFKVKLAAEVKGFNPEDYMDRKNARRLDRFCQLAMAAAKEVMEDSKLDVSKIDATRFGIIVGSGIGGLNTTYEISVLASQKGPDRVPPLSIPMVITNMASGNISIEYGAKGETFDISAACSTGTHCIGEAYRLIKYGYQDVIMAKDVIGEDAKFKATNLKEGEILLLENVRFHREETDNDPEFSKTLASMAEVYVNDAFGAAHRAHSSTVGVASYLPAVSGFLIEKELKFLGDALNNPKRPFMAILGGAKVSDKIGVIDNLLEKVDTLMIGGGMAYTFFKAQGYSVGVSICEEDKLDLALELMKKAKEKGVKLMLPVDTRVGKEFKPDTESKTVPWTEIPDGWEGFDIGEKTIEMYSEELRKAKTVVWNGPLGLFEFDQFAKGTNAIAKVLSELTDATTIIGGGDSAAAVRKAGLQDKMTHISTGGGASLEFLEGKKLPGIECLQDK